MFHYRSTRKKYASYKPDDCPFCSKKMLAEEIAETTHAFIVPNRVFYDLWEMRKVTDHLLVIPKRHVRSLAELSEAERLDIINVVSEYEAKNYNVYARAVDSRQRSVAHQHTHLIKTEEKQAWFYLFIKKPYLLIKF